jgi:hypothetical protein
MILETLSGGLLGGVLRLAPELLKVLDRKNERKHELEMTHLSFEADREHAKAALALQESQASANFDTGALQALLESVRTQGQPSGVSWIDGLSSLVRPSITFAFFGLYALCRVATGVAALNSGIPALDVLRATWTAEDQIVLSGILNFWFLGRVFEKATR